MNRKKKIVLPYRMDAKFKILRLFKTTILKKKIMKAILSIILLLVVLQGVSQRKKKADPRDEKIDSLTATNALLTVKMDSLTKEQKVYTGMYATIKDKVLLKDFDPEKL